MINSVKLEGEEGVSNVIEAAISAHLRGMEGTEVQIVAGGNRGQRENTLIAKVQAGHMRDPFYLDQQAMEAVRFAAGGLMAAQYSVRKRALEIIGELMLNAIGRNVEKQKNPGGGSFKPLTPNYAAYKRRKFGFVTPILKATNDLLGGLKVLIKGLK